MAMFGLNDVQLFWERSLDTRVLVGWSSDMIVLSFRGTASLKNAFADIQVHSCCCQDIHVADLSGAPVHGL
jgi:hypothetical protein